MTSGTIATFTGRMIEPLRPDPAQICIEDIAHALANMCRFTGHVREFYSVAQHSVLVSRIVSPANAFVGLMHDASEAYLADIARPVKQQPVFGVAYKAAELTLMEAIAERFEFAWPPPEEVHRADNVLLVTEARDLMHGTKNWSSPYQEIEPLPETIEPWLPHVAEKRFITRYFELEGTRCST